MEITNVEYEIEYDTYKITIEVIDDDDTLIMRVSKSMTLDELKEIPDYPLIEKILLAVKEEKEAGLH